MRCLLPLRDARTHGEGSTQGGNDHWSTSDFPKALASDENKAAFYALPVFLSGILMYNLIFHLLGST